MPIYKLTDAEHATVLAALRHYERDMNAGVSLHHVADIATNSGAIAPLIEVGALAESLNHAGLSFGEIVAEIGESSDNPYVAAAHYSDKLNDDLEVDGRAIVSEGEGGAFVSCWLWVSNDDAGVEETQP